MSVRSRLGWAGIVGGLVLAAAGGWLIRRFRAPTDGGEPRFRPAGPPLNGVLEWLGTLLLAFGLCAAGVGLLVLLA